MNGTRLNCVLVGNDILSILLFLNGNKTSQNCRKKNPSEEKEGKLR